jgi:NAD+ kinase
MSEDAGTLAVGLVGGDDAATEAIRRRAASVTTGDASAVLDAAPDLLVAIGETALRSVARERPPIPILPVAAGPGVCSVAEEQLTESVAAVARGDFETDRHPVLAVETDGGIGAAVFDVTLTAAEPARISAFTVGVDGEQMGPVRADGVVVATPAGTGGYARALDAPTIPPEAGVLAVEPIAQFATRPDRWVLPAETLTVTVARDSVPVQVLADDSSVASIGQGDPVTIDPDGTIETVVVPASPSALADGSAELEKH